MPTKRVRIFERDGWRCWYCGLVLPREACELKDSPTLDHVIPLEHGGDSNESNLVCACRRCNSQKGTKTLSEYRDYCARMVFSEVRALKHLQKALEEIDFPADLQIERAVEWLQRNQRELKFYGEREKEEQ